MSLAATLSDGGEGERAEAILREAIAVCEAAALTPIAIEACSALARLNWIAARPVPAREAADRAGKLAQQMHDPISHAAALEAGGIVAELEDGLRALTEAQQAWQQVNRRLDGARCEALRGERLRESDTAAARTTIEAAALSFGELGVAHLAASSWELAGR